MVAHIEHRNAAANLSTSHSVHTESHSEHSRPVHTAMDIMYRDKESRQNPYREPLRMGIPSLMIAAPPKSGTTSLSFSLKKYPDIWKRRGEPQYWVHANLSNDTAYCQPTLTTSEWTDWIEQYAQSKTSLSSLHSMIPSICNVDGFRREIEREWTEQPNNHCTNPMVEHSSSCWFIEKTPHYSWHPFVSILVSNLLPNTRYLTVLRDPVTHVWSNYFHFGGGSALKMKLRFYVFTQYQVAYSMFFFLQRLLNHGNVSMLIVQGQIPKERKSTLWIDLRAMWWSRT